MAANVRNLKSRVSFARVSTQVPLTRVLDREAFKSRAVSVEGAEIRRLGQQALAPYLELARLRAAVAAIASEFEYREPEPYASSAVTVRFRPGEVAQPPQYDFD
jgi:hypothetical protein